MREAKMETMSADPDVADLSYEQARDELMRVVMELEQGAPTLEHSLALWERGELLAARCEQWLIGAKLAPPNYIASQGAALRRSGRVHIETVGADIWVGGDVAPLISGEVDL